MEERVCFSSSSFFFILIFGSSYQGRITNQLYRLGCSYDWDRVAFTMNEVCSSFSPLDPSNTFFLESQQSSHRNFLQTLRRRHLVPCKQTRQLVCEIEYYFIQSRGLSLGFHSVLIHPHWSCVLGRSKTVNRSHFVKYTRL